MRWSWGNGGGLFWFLTRSPLMASLVAAVPTLMAMSATALPPLHAVCSGGFSRRRVGPSGLLGLGLRRLQRRR